MSRVLCTGGESCGTRLLARLVGQMGADALHRSYPHGREWPQLDELDFDSAVVITRDWTAASRSQVAAGHVASVGDALGRLRRAATEIPAQLEDLAVPWLQVSYESLVRRPRRVLADLAGWLHLDPGGVTEPIRDGNTRWLGEVE